MAKFCSQQFPQQVLFCTYIHFLIEVNFKNPGIYILKISGKGMEINKRVVIK